VNIITMAGLDPAIQSARIGRKKNHWLADARLLGGRVKPGHGEQSNYLATFDSSARRI
jgi:hypothetical protein